MNQIMPTRRFLKELSAVYGRPVPITSGPITLSPIIYDNDANPIGCLDLEGEFFSDPSGYYEVSLSGSFPLIDQANSILDDVLVELDDKYGSDYRLISLKVNGNKLL